MNELDNLRHQLAQAIAGYRMAEQRATRSLVVLDCTLGNIATQFRLFAFQSARYRAHAA